MKKHTKTVRIKTPKNKKHTLRVWLAVISIVILVVLSVVCVFVIYFGEYNIDTDIDLSIFEHAGSDTVTRLYYINDGSAVEIESERLYGSQVTVYAPYNSIPQNLKDAFVAIEDKRFFKHSGVDWFRTAGAGANYIMKFRSSFGASTITQQLIKNVTQKDDVTVSRKVQEIVYALDLESKMEKDEILEFYLNIVNLSQGCYGVGSAANKYFSKNVSELTLNECACIAAITKNPSYYDPLTHPENNAARRDVILSQMRAQGYISDEEFDSAYEKEITLNIGRTNETVNSWYTDMVVSDVVNDLVNELGYTKGAASYLVYSGGLKIYTTMDEEIQQIVTGYFENTANFPADDLEKGRCAMIIADPESGDILAVAGSIGKKSANRIQNFATDTVRPSGSCIKPLSVYAPALEEGLITWSSVYDDVPIAFEEQQDGSFKTWPNNANMTYRGLTNISYAVKKSLNTVSIRVLNDLGNDKSFEYLTKKFNIKSLVEADRGTAALALGQQNYGVSLREVTSAYTTFCNRGVCCQPRSYVTVLDRDGNVLLSRETRRKQVISEGNAAVMTKLLQNVTESTATITLKKDYETAGKTGTTQDTCDLWFIGYTPYYLGGVWYGHEYPETLPYDARSMSTTTWNAVMSLIHEKKVADADKKTFTVPENVIQASYCADSGLLMTGACMSDPRGDRSETGWFVDGTQPTGFCACHVSVDCGERGGILFGNYTDEPTVKAGLITVERSFPSQIFVTDAQYVYRPLPDGIAPSFDENLPFFAPMLKDDEFCGISETDKQFNRTLIKIFIPPFTSPPPTENGQN